MILSGEATFQAPEVAENPLTDRTAVLIRLIDKGAAVLTAIAQWTGIGAVAYCAYLAIAALAGQNTALFISYLTDTGCGITVSISLGVGVLGAAYGWGQRRLLRRTNAHHGPRLARYETQRDPNRSSSNLTPQGMTNPDDLP